MRNKSSLKLKNQLWFRLFLKIGLIFIIFVLLLFICNSAFLKEYYEYTRTEDLKSTADEIYKTDLNDTEEMIDIISDIEEDYGFETEIYTEDGSTVFSSSGGQMMNYFFQGDHHLHMHHRPMEIIKVEDKNEDGVLLRAKDIITEKEYLVYRFSLKASYICEIRVQITQIESSAKTANTFITIIAVIFLFLALIWVFWFAKRISRPISRMNEITQKMAALDFEQKLKPSTKDEIGQLALSINDLSGKLDMTLRDLKASNAQLRNEIELERQLDNMRRDFVANVSHELKTPIAIIQGYAEGLKLDINSDAREKYCDTIMDEGRRMNKLVLGLLSLSKYESGQIELNNQSFNISRLLRAMANRIFENTDTKLIYNFKDNIMVMADPDQIEQVIKSYLENAASHVDKGGTVTITVLEQEGEYNISVHNTGSHIDEEVMPQIWQSFFRGDPSHNRESGRFGLGLSIVSAIIKLHGQNCGVYNTENGVCFWFTAKKVENS